MTIDPNAYICPISQTTLDPAVPTVRVVCGKQVCHTLGTAFFHRYYYVPDLPEALRCELQLVWHLPNRYGILTNIRFIYDLADIPMDQTTEMVIGVVYATFGAAMAEALRTLQSTRTLMDL